ncbi:MAG TPA: dTMP kinase [Burkholderiaceae bacterium]|nr:dTMP kinase [Burkholderiaceae bacterium]
MTERGRFITFEGIDGAGKSTQIQVVADVLRSRGIEVVITREPGGTPLAEALRNLVLNEPMDPSTETLLLFAARSDHLERVLRPALEAGRWVLCDRFTDATYAYQAGGRGVPVDKIATLERWVHPDMQPDLTLLFDLPPEIAAQRLAQARAADRFESEQLDFFGAVRSQYLERAAAFPARFFVVDSTASPDEIRHLLTNLMARWNG